MKKFLIKKISLIFSLVLVVMIMSIFHAISCSVATLSGLTVFAAAGSKPALDEICRNFEDKYRTTVEITYGGGGEVLSQMELSRRGDVYVAPEQRFMEKAAEKQLIEPKTVTSIAYMVPVIAVPKDNPKDIKTLEDFAVSGVRVAITRTETTLLGKYAPEIFEKAGLAEAIGRNIVTEAVRPDNLLTMLIMGQVDAGIIWNFYEVQASEDIEVIYLTPEQITGIGEIQAAVTAYTNNRDGAGEFIDYLASSEGKKIFKNLGYIIDEKEVEKYQR